MAPPVKILPKIKGARGKHTGAAAKIRKLKLKHPEMSEVDLAKATGCDPANAHRVIKNLEQELLDGNTSEELEAYRRREVDYLTAHRKRILGSITDDVVENASYLQRVTGFGIVFDKERLLTGQATQINVNVLLDVANAIKQERDRE